MKEKMGTVIGFKIGIDGSGVLCTEYSRLPDEDIPKIFKDSADAQLIRVVIREALRRFEKLHEEIEAELDAIRKVT